MGEIILSQAGAIAGSAVLPGGVTAFGQTFSGAAIGRTIGQLAGRAIDASLMPATEGPRVKSLTVMESREGAGLPTVYGRMRVGGQVIWASRFREKRRERSAGKGGPKYAEYTYSVSFAVALCQGPITRVDRIWANGEAITLADVNWRLYHGSETQDADPLIEATEGTDAAPAYRGVAYIVFEDLPLDPYGNRMPQLSFEVVRAGQTDSYSLGNVVEGVNIIPASGEFVYATSVVRERRFPGIERALNMNNGDGRADFAVSVDQLRSDLPKVREAALTVAWFGDDLRAGDCRLRPGVETRERDTVPYGWQVNETGRGSAHLISATGDSSNYGGTPADRAVLEGIAALNAAGVSVTMSPFILMDVPNGNGLSDPYGAAEQAAFPWRGRVTAEANGTAAARAAIETFVGEDGGFGFRHFILHHARLAAASAGVDAFLLGSELVGLTRVRDGAGAFPFVEALVELAAEVKAIVGPSVAVSYAADWTEYGAYQVGSSVYFPLDQLWASPHVDFVGVDWYPPAGDWRDGDDHLDLLAGYEGADDPAYLLANMAGGEAFDWYYVNAADRDAQLRTPIVDTAHGEDWVFRQKDLLGWWRNAHHERPDGVRASAPTQWQAASKPIRLIEIGFPAVDRGGNSPNLFFDPKSSESALPPYSNGARDDLFQRRALSAALGYWSMQAPIEQALVWAWDGRPWPDYPAREDIWADGPNWQFGHWLNGRSGLIELSEIIGDIADRAGVQIDVTGLNGFVEGFAIDGVTDLRNALTPLEAAYGVRCRERVGVLDFHQAEAISFEVDKERLVEASFIETRTLLEKQPGRLSLGYISGDFSYAPAIAEARNDQGDRDYVVRVSLPLVMGKARAEIIAGDLLRDILSLQSGHVAFGPEMLGFEVGDAFRLGDGEVVEVLRVKDKGLMREVQVAQPSQRGGIVRSVVASGVGEPAPVFATPELVLIDGPKTDDNAVYEVIAAVTADPWVGRVVLSTGTEITNLEANAVFDAPCGIGVVQSEVGASGIGRWDEAAVLHVELRGEDLAGQIEAAVLAGANRALVEGVSGWELIGWRDADLIGDDIWTLSGLLRGLSGTPADMIEVGARIVLVDDRLKAVAQSAEEIGVETYWQAGQAPAQLFKFEAMGHLALRVGHMRAERSGDSWLVSWTPRVREISDNINLPEANLSGTWIVEVLQGETVLQSFETTVPRTELSIVGADLVRVAALGTDNRVGRWASIPLIAD